MRCLFYLAVVIGRPSAHSARLLSFLACWSWWSPVVDCTPRRNEATSFADGRALHLVVHAVVRAHPACLAGAHVCVGIAGPHIHSSALSASEEASSPARYRALRIRFDPPSNPPPVGGTRVQPLPRLGVSRLSHPLRGGDRRSASSRGADGLRFGKARGFVDRGLEDQSRDRPNPRDAAEAPAQLIPADQLD